MIREVLKYCPFLLLDEYVLQQELTSHFGQLWGHMLAYSFFTIRIYEIQLLSRLSQNDSLIQSRVLGEGEREREPSLNFYCTPYEK